MWLMLVSATVVMVSVVVVVEGDKARRKAAGWLATYLHSPLTTTLLCNQQFFTTISQTSLNLPCDSGPVQTLSVYAIVMNFICNT